MQRFVCRENVYYNDKIYIMGILNITPDSFSDGGMYSDVDRAVCRALQMQNEGADFIDIGAVSTRPGASFVSQEKELNRLLPVLRALRDKLQIPVSVDTFRPEVAAAALQNGAAIINDVSGYSDAMAAVVRQYKAGWVAVHSVGASAAEVTYPHGVVSAVQSFFDSFRNRAMQAGVAPEQIMFDPGFGFAKNTQQNKELLENLEKLNTDTSFLLTALSRKRFVGALTGVEDPARRLEGTLLFDRQAIEKGSCILRVHDVKEHRQMTERISL